jgi:hypothetical protein
MPQSMIVSLQITASGASKADYLPGTHPTGRKSRHAEKIN